MPSATSRNRPRARGLAHVEAPSGTHLNTPVPVSVPTVSSQPANNEQDLMSPSTLLSAGPQTQDLPVDLQGRLLREPPEHTHEATWYAKPT